MNNQMHSVALNEMSNERFLSKVNEGNIMPKQDKLNRKW